MCNFRQRTAVLKIKSHFSAISPTYYIPYFPALIRPIKIFLLYFKARLRSLSMKYLSSMKQTPIIATNSAGRREPILHPGHPALRRHILRFKKDFQAKHVSWPGDTYQQRTRCKFYQICLGAMFFLPHFPPPHGIRERVRRAAGSGQHWRPQALVGLGSARQMLAWQTWAPAAFQVPLAATTPVPSTSPPDGRKPNPRHVAGMLFSCVQGHSNSHMSRHFT